MRSGTVVVGAGARRRVGSTVVGRVDASGGTSDAQCEVCYAGCDVACFYHHSRHPMCSFECRSESSFESSFECSFFRSFPVARRCRVRFRVCDVRCCMCDVRCCHFGIFVICWLFDSHSSSHSGSRFDSRFDSHFDSHLCHQHAPYKRAVFTLKSGTEHTYHQPQAYKCKSPSHKPQR